MSKISYLLAFLTQVIAQALADSYCAYTPTWSSTTLHKWCSWGCCYSYLDDPCCYEPYYVEAPFIVGIVCGGIFLIICIILAIVYRRRRYTATRVTYLPPGNQQVFSTSSNNTTVGGYASPPPPYGTVNPNYQGPGQTVQNTNRVMTY